MNSFIPSRQVCYPINSVCLLLHELQFFSFLLPGILIDSFRFAFFLQPIYEPTFCLVAIMCVSKNQHIPGQFVWTKLKRASFKNQNICGIFRQNEINEIHSRRRNSYLLFGSMVPFFRFTEISSFFTLYIHDAKDKYTTTLDIFANRSRF